MHNGQVGGYVQIKRDIEAMIPDRLYGSRIGNSDSEAIFLAALANGLSDDPITAMVRTLRAVHGLMIDAGITEPLGFTAAFTDGETLFGLRWASDDRPPSLYYRESSENLVIASEPIDGYKANWSEVPKSCSFVAKPGCPISLKSLEELKVKVAA